MTENYWKWVGANRYEWRPESGRVYWMRLKGAGWLPHVACGDGWSWVSPEPTGGDQMQRVAEEREAKLVAGQPDLPADGHLDLSGNELAAVRDFVRKAGRIADVLRRETEARESAIRQLAKADARCEFLGACSQTWKRSAKSWRAAWGSVSKVCNDAENALVRARHEADGWRKVAKNNIERVDTLTAESERLQQSNASMVIWLVLMACAAVASISVSILTAV